MLYKNPWRSAFVSSSGNFETVTIHVSDYDVWQTSRQEVWSFKKFFLIILQCIRESS